MSGPLSAAGVLIATAAAATAILAPPGRLRSASMLAALALLPILILGDRWHSHQIVDLRDHPARLAALAATGLAIVALSAVAFARWPAVLPLAIVATLPFRVPLDAGGHTANLLVPLYLVIGGGALAAALQARSARPWAPSRTNGGAAGKAVLEPPPRVPPAGAPARARDRAVKAWLPRVLAAVVLLYAAQTLYSADFSRGLQNVCFFLVPFTVTYALLSECEWDRKLLTRVLWVVALEAVVFVAIGSVQYATRGLFWNPQVIRSNEFHTYFRVNSVFWDPNIYGRYLALAIVVAMAALLWARERRTFALLTALVTILWIGLVPTFSQSSFIALLAGLAVLAALRWSLRWTLGVAAVGALGAVLVVLSIGSSGINLQRLNIDTSGRANLVSGGIRLFGQRPLWGYGSGSFQKAYREHAATHRVPVSASHTEPVTVAAEQGAIGLLAYAALLVVALWTMAPGRGQALAVGTAAVLAAFIALLVHTMAYAGFFEDPFTWVLLAVGAALAV